MNIEIITGRGIKGIQLQLDLFEMQAIADLIHERNDLIQKKEQAELQSGKENIQNEIDEITEKAFIFLKNVSGDIPSRKTVGNGLFELQPIKHTKY